MPTTEVNVAALSGPALDWAVAIALGWDDVLITDYADPDSIDEPFFRPGKMLGKEEICGQGVRWRPSSDQLQGGTLMDREKISTEYVRGRGEWMAFTTGALNIMKSQYGPDRLVAAARVLVELRIGTTLQIPSQLLPSTSGDSRSED